MNHSDPVRIVRPTERKEISKLIKRKQKEREEDFSRLRSLYKFGADEEKIVELGWDSLVGQLQSRQLSATRVLEAYLAKALVVCEKCNPVTDFIPQAHFWAKELDLLPEVKGPLHGIPFCVKDDTNVVGMDSTHGFGKRLYEPATESAVLIKVLQDLGAIPFAKTNVPQALWNLGGVNPVFGATKNAHNPKLTPGGSSSGTGALVGAGGALFGTGTDLGGSVRIPAHFNGAASMKPTAFRLSLLGLAAPVDPIMVGLEPVFGIIGQTPTIVAAVYEAMISSGLHSQYDVIVPPIPWNRPLFESKRPLRIGYNVSLPFFPSVGDSGPTVLKAKQALESLGHTLVEVDLPDPYRFVVTFGAILLSDPRDFRRIWKGEEVTDDNKAFTSALNTPAFAISVLQKLVRSCHSERLAVNMNPPAKTSTDVVDAVAEKKDLVRQILAYWDSLKLDGIIHNVLPIPAVHAKLVSKIGPAMAYTLLWNLVEFPAGVATLGSESGQKLNEFKDEGDMIFKAVKKYIHESVGSPIGVQVVGKPYQDELVLRIMKELEPFNTFKPPKQF